MATIITDDPTDYPADYRAEYPNDPLREELLAAQAKTAIPHSGEAFELAADKRPTKGLRLTWHERWHLALRALRHRLFGK